MNWSSVANRSYLRKVLADTRAAALSPVGGIEPDPDGPTMTAGERRERLLRVLNVADTGQSLADVEALAAAALDEPPAAGVPEHQAMAGLYPKAMLRRADVLGEEARQPEDFTVRLVDDVPEEQGPEGP